jgi:hypothetical protein
MLVFCDLDDTLPEAVRRGVGDAHGLREPLGRHRFRSSGTPA